MIFEDSLTIVDDLLRILDGGFEIFWRYIQIILLYIYIFSPKSVIFVGSPNRLQTLRTPPFVNAALLDGEPL